MIELNGIYKLKRIRGLESNDQEDYKVIAVSDSDFIICEKLSGYDKGERFLFMKEFLVDPEFPNDIYSKLVIIKKEK